MSVKPQLYKESSYAFDSNYEHEFKYIWNESNNQSVANLLTIRNNITNNIVYQQTQETLLLKHILPANTLQNGLTYNASIQVYDREGVLSESSDSVVFKSLTTPTLSLNISQEQIVRSSSYSFEITYTQTENEDLQYYILELYDSNMNYMYSTSYKYNIESSTVITDLIDNTSYYIKAKGETINHMLTETNMILFHVDYIRPSEYSYITVENRYEHGDVLFTSFLVSIEGYGIDGQPIFENGCVDAVNGTSIKFDKNFNINNGQLLLKGKGFLINNTFLILENSSNHTMVFTWRYGTYEENNDIEKWYIELICTDGNVSTMHISNFIDYDSSKFYNINVKIINNHIDIYINEEVDE